MGLGKRCLIYPFYRLDLLKTGWWMDQSGLNVAEVGEGWGWSEECIVGI